MRISDWSSDVCSSDLLKREIDQQNGILLNNAQQHQETDEHRHGNGLSGDMERQCAAQRREHQRSHIYKWRQDAFVKQHQHRKNQQRSEEHTSELQSLMRNSYAVFSLKNKNNTTHHISITSTDHCDKTKT